MPKAFLEKDMLNLRTVLNQHAMHLTHDREAAKDLIQETMLKALLNSDKFESGSNLGAWLYTIMRNIFITQYHKENRRRQILSQLPDMLHMEKVHHEKIHSELAKEDLMKCVGKVPQKYREPFLMYFQGFKYEEIAESLSIPLGTVKNHIFMARQQLKKMNISAQKEN